ncbi:MAG: cation transporter [Clostridia bacterium]
MRKVYKMEDLECAHCAGLMEEEIKKLDGVNKVSLNFISQKMSLDCNEDKLDDILKKAQKICKKFEPDCTIIL